MATQVKISQLPIAPFVSIVDTAPVVHSGQTVQASAQQIYRANRRDGIIHAIDASGISAPTAVTFSPAFASTLLALNGIVFVNYSGGDFPVLVYKITGASASGFTIQITGGDPATTVDVHYGATGE